VETRYDRHLVAHDPFSMLFRPFHHGRLFDPFVRFNKISKMFDDFKFDEGFNEILFKSLNDFDTFMIIYNVYQERKMELPNDICKCACNGGYFYPLKFLHETIHNDCECKYHLDIHKHINHLIKNTAC